MRPILPDAKENAAFAVCFEALKSLSSTSPKPAFFTMSQELRELRISGVTRDNDFNSYRPVLGKLEDVLGSVSFLRTSSGSDTYLKGTYVRLEAVELLVLTFCTDPELVRGVATTSDEINLCGTASDDKPGKSCEIDRAAEITDVGLPGIGVLNLEFQIPSNPIPLSSALSPNGAASSSG